MRKFLLFLQTLALTVAPLATVAQNQPPKPQDPPEVVVRITTNLIQVDAIVTDKDGKLVTDLKPEDFRITEDGKEQKISNFSFVMLQAETPKVEPVKAMPKLAAGKVAAPPVPTAVIKPEQVRRTLAFIADDLGMSFVSTAQAREALKKFVDEQMQPGDLVAILRSSAGSGALQQFTSDKRLLHAAIERLQWYPLGRSTISPFEEMGGRSSLEVLKAGAAITTPTGPSGRAGAIPAGSASPAANPSLTERDDDGALTTQREQLSSVGTIGAMRYVIDGLRYLPGRKSVVLVSDGLPIFPPVGQVGGAAISNSRLDTSSRDIITALQNLTERANRASVVIHTMDVRGLQTLGLNAADDTQGSFTIAQAATGSAAAAANATINNRRGELRNENFRTQDGLNYLSAQTGGLFIHDSNDLGAGIQKIVDEQRGYYLIGYEPDEATFNAEGRRTFHKLVIEVKNPKLKVRSRTGFYGIADEEFKRPLDTPVQQINAALATPFTTSGVAVNFTSLFSGDPGQPVIRSLIHVNARDLTFVKQEAGDYLCTVDVATATHDANGQTIDRGARGFTLRVKEADYERTLRDGILYTFDLPIKKAGAYQLRLVVLDEKSKRTGTASQFIEAPDLGKTRLTLSGISINGEYEKGGNSAALIQASPALRRLRRGMLLNYGYVIYHAKLDAGLRPQLTTQVKLFLDGKEVFAGKPANLIEAQPARVQRIVAGGAINLGANLNPGEYVLQVIAQDRTVKEKDGLASQWMTFTIVE